MLSIRKGHEIRGRLRIDREAIVRETQIRDNLRPQKAARIGRDRHAKAGMDLLGDCRPADGMIAFQHQHAFSGSPQIAGGDQPIVPSTDDHRIIAFRHSCSSCAAICYYAAAYGPTDPSPLTTMDIAGSARSWRAGRRPAHAACIGLANLAPGLIPAGLHFDEASHGLLVEDHILRGETPVFFSAYTGHEALFHYTVAPFLLALGPTILALRLPAALWSSALVPLVYLLGTRLWGRHQGVAAALATACGGWLVHVGRIAFRANALPAISALAVWWLYRALTDTTPRLRRRAAILSGACFGLSLYTYLAVRMLLLLGPLLLVYLVIWHRPLLRRSSPDLPWFMLALVVVSTPLVVHMIRVPGDFLERVRQIGISTSDAQESRLHQAARQTLLTLLMFGVRGARDGFFNLPFRPVFPGIAAVPFYLGALVALRHWRSLAHALVCSGSA